MSSMGRLAHLAATGQFGHGPARVATGVTGPAEDKDQGAGGHAQPSIAVDSSGQHIVIASNYAEGFGLNPFRCPASNIPTRTPTSRWERSTVWNILPIRLTKAKHASARQSYVRGSASHAAYVNAIGCQLATAPIMNGRFKTGSRFPFPPWSVKIHSL